MKAMRVMAGHPDEKGSVFLPRDHIKPSMTLQQTIFPFLEKEIESIDAANNSTAYEFLKNMSHHLNLVQDPVDLRIDSILPGVRD
jgi:hypothetical protein